MTENNEHAVNESDEHAMTENSIYLLATGAVPAYAAEDAAKRGAILDSIEFIQTETLTDIPEMEQLIARRLTVVFTSINAVHAVQQWIKAVIPEWKVYCIGGSTYDAVRKSFGADAVMGTAASASQLSEMIREREPAGTAGIVFFSGDRRREELPSLGVKEVVVYRTVLAPRQIARNYQAIAFFSPGAVESFFSVNDIGPDVPLFAIGATTAEAIRNRRSNPVTVCERPDKALLIRRMTDEIVNKR